MQQTNALVAATIALGTLYCFLGYRTLRFALGLGGFILAGGVAATIVNWITQGNQTAALIGLFCGGVCGAYALVFLYRTGIFFLGLVAAALIAQTAIGARPEMWIPGAIFLVAVIGGLVALLMERPVILLSTSAVGAWIVISGVVYFIVSPDELSELHTALMSDDQKGIVLIAWCVLAVAGVLSQFATTQPKKVLKKVKV